MYFNLLFVEWVLGHEPVSYWVANVNIERKLNNQTMGDSKKPKLDKGHGKGEWLSEEKANVNIK